MMKFILLVETSTVSKYQNISKQFGEWGIKLKRNTWKALRPVGIILLGVLGCLILFYLVDHVWNGYFVEWFEKNCMVTTDRYLPEAGQVAVIHELNWDVVKPLLLWTMIGCVVIGLIIVFVVA